SVIIIFFFMLRPPPTSTLFPYTTLFRSYMADTDTADPNSDFMSGVKSVVATNASTVTVTYEAATANPYQFGTGGGNEIMQKAQFEKCLGAKASECPENLKPIGTGPYKLTEFKSGDVVTYEINTNY